jgi:demethylmenaquinone methyltransferase/2-methoxy-6-polyprenyl-1,4-benzoquinol methylase
MMLALTPTAARPRMQGVEAMKTPVRTPTRAPFIRAMFGRIAGRYDLMNTLMTGGRHHAWRRLAVREARPAGGRAVDVCCGTGDFALELTRQGASAAIGVDFSREMLALAARKAQVAGLAGRVQWQLADAMELPFPNDAFACATSGFSLRNVDDVGRALREMSRVIAPGGRVVVLELTPVRSRLFGPLFRAYFRGLVPLVGGLLAGDRAAYTYLPDSVLAFPTAEALADLMREAGLVDVRYRLLALGTVALHLGVKP